MLSHYTHGLPNPNPVHFQRSISFIDCLDNHFVMFWLRAFVWKDRGLYWLITINGQWYYSIYKDTVPLPLYTCTLYQLTPSTFPVISSSQYLWCIISGISRKSGALKYR